MASEEKQKETVVDDVIDSISDHLTRVTLKDAPQTQQQQQQQQQPTILLIAKYGKERIVLQDLTPDTTLLEVKHLIRSQTNILPKRQKLVGLVALQGGAKGVTDDLPLSGLKVKTKTTDTVVVTHQFILMGTPEEHIFIDPSERDDLPDVIDDFEFDFNAGSAEWLQHVANEEKLKQFTDDTVIYVMNPPRAGKPLLVLDLDHTLVDCSSSTSSSTNTTRGGIEKILTADMKRPYMNEFLTQCYQWYDLVLWSQTSRRWLETKATELGMLTHPGYKFTFCLDKTSMFTVTSWKRDGTRFVHHVKPLQIIWKQFPDYWNVHNTIHIDDLSRNFALNLSSGLKIKAFYRRKSRSRNSSRNGNSSSSGPDSELQSLTTYLHQLAHAGKSFEQFNFDEWSESIQKDSF